MPKQLCAIAAGLALFGTLGLAQAPAKSVPDQPTFSKDVAPILQSHCQTCHRPGNIGPMSLLTYPEVRPWARAI